MTNHRQARRFDKLDSCAASSPLLPTRPSRTPARTASVCNLPKHQNPALDNERQSRSMGLGRDDDTDVEARACFISASKALGRGRSRVRRQEAIHLVEDDERPELLRAGESVSRV